jgi:hypothetical protein
MASMVFHTLSLPATLAWPLGAVEINDISSVVKSPHAPGTPEFYWKLCISVVLVLAGGVFAGLARTHTCGEVDTSPL